MMRRDAGVSGEGALPLRVGAFLSLVFVLVGGAGAAFTVPRLARWYDAARWTRVQGEVVSGELVHVNAPRGGATVRPRFVWRYRVDGRELVGEGFGLTDVTTADVARAERALAARPPGSAVEVLVDPHDPTRSALEREPVSHVLVLLVPPFFALLGLLGGALTLGGARGWFDAGSRHPVRRAGGVALRWLLRRSVLAGIVLGAFGLGIGALVLFAVRRGDPTALVFAAALGYGLWRAARPRAR